MGSRAATERHDYWQARRVDPSIDAGGITAADFARDPGCYQGSRNVKLQVQPISVQSAKVFVAQYHRHQRTGRQRPVVSGLWAHSVIDEAGDIRGVCIVGRPVARAYDDGVTCEVTRVAVHEAPNACSMLYGVAARTARVKGFTSVVSYIHAQEPGTSLKAAGWVRDAIIRGQSWNCASRPRELVLFEDRQRWWTPWSVRLGRPMLCNDALQPS